MGNRIGKLFGSRSRSEDITPVPSKSKKDTKESTATNAPPPNVARAAPTTLVSETIKKDIESSEATGLKTAFATVTASLTNDESLSPATIATKPEPATSTPKRDTEESTATDSPPSNGASAVPQAIEKTTPTLVSETVKKDIELSEVTELNNSALVTNVESPNSEIDPDSSNDLPEFLIALLKVIAEKEGFTDYTFDVSAGSNHGDGFLAVVKRVIVSGTRNGKTDFLPLICKLMPTSKARREQFNSDAVFIREAFMYSQVLPTFTEFQKEKGLSTKDGFCEYPKCYGTLDDKESDSFVIVLEDLKATGYEMFDKFKAADFNHVKLFAESLGKFHAVSFALKDQRPEVFAKFTHLKDVFLQQVEDQPDTMVPMFHFFFDKSIAAFKPEEEAEINALTKLKESVLEELRRTATGAASEPFSIINHGDCWNNNMMYVYGTESNVPVNISLLDYQISRYSSPALDLVYFLFSSTDKPLRDGYYTEVLQLYHKALSTNLTKMGSDASKLFTFDDLQCQLKEFGRYALIIAPMLLNIITTKADDIPDLDNLAEEYKDKTVEESMKAFLNDSAIDKFNARIRDVVQDVLRLGYY